MNSASVHECDIAIIGGGVSGLSAAAQCAERGATVICIDENSMPGGVIANIGKLDGYPGPNPMAGASLAVNMIESCKALDVTFLNAAVASLMHSASKTAVVTDQGTIVAKIVIVASGARLRQLGIPGEAELAGRGVSQCNWCDGGFFRNESVVVVGGGDAAFQAALHLSSICESVTIVMRGSDIRARRAYVLQAGDNERISFYWDTVVDRICGVDGVKSVVLRNLGEDRVEELPVTGVFIFAGTEPNAGFLPPEIERDETGLVITNGDYRTSVPGIYAVGGVRSGYRGALMSACGEGAAAAAAAVEEMQRREMM
jgi:thioredoxin reductase (NADPH)